GTYRTVLVSYMLYSSFSLSHTEPSHREAHQAGRTGLEAMPLNQYVESRHGAREPGLERRPHAVHDLSEVTDEGQHREHRFRYGCRLGCYAPNGSNHGRSPSVMSNTLRQYNR